MLNKDNFSKIHNDVWKEFHDMQGSMVTDEVKLIIDLATSIAVSVIEKYDQAKNDHCSSS